MVNQINSEQYIFNRSQMVSSHWICLLCLNVWLMWMWAWTPDDGRLICNPRHTVQCVKCGATRYNVSNVVPHSLIWQMWRHTVLCVKCGATHSNPRHTGKLSHQVAAIFHVLCHIFWFNPSQQRSAISQFHTLSLLKLSPNHQARAVLVAVWMYLSLREEIAFDNSVN